MSNSCAHVLAFRFVLRIMGKCASRSGPRRDPDCGMVYIAGKKSMEFLQGIPRNRVICSDLPVSTELHIKSRFYTRLIFSYLPFKPTRTWWDRESSRKSRKIDSQHVHFYTICTRSYNWICILLLTQRFIRLDYFVYKETTG